MSSNEKRIKRLKRLSYCIECGDLKGLKHYLRREKYCKLNLSQAIVNKKNQTLLHLACRFCKPDIVNFLLQNSICDPGVGDHKQNLPLHLALKSVLRIVERKEFVEGKQNYLAKFLTITIFFLFQHTKTLFCLN